MLAEMAKNDELLARLSTKEDNFTERKPERMFGEGIFTLRHLSQ